MQKPPPEKKKKSQSPLNPLVRFSGMAIQMGATIFIGAYSGKYLDAKYEIEGKWFTMALTLSAVALALYVILRQLNRYNK